MSSLSLVRGRIYNYGKAIIKNLTRFGDVMTADTQRGTRRLLVALVATVLLVLAGGLGTASAQGDVDDPAQVDAGKVVYEANCAGCHGATGEGSNSGRPLVGVAMQEADRSVHIMSVTDGKGNMPAFGERLSADEIDSAVSYVRLTFVQAEPELAVTGPKGTQIAFLGALVVLVGMALVAFSRRQQLA